MLIACITGPDLPSVKKQLEKAHALCDAVEIRTDLIDKSVPLPPISLPIIDCIPIVTQESVFGDVGDTSNFGSVPRSVSIGHCSSSQPKNLRASLPKSRIVNRDRYEVPTYHNYQETPEDLDAILQALPKGKVVKIATMANCVTDSLRMLDLVRRHENVAGMCMGLHGAITRILAQVYGSPMTFVAVGREAAMGQLQAEELIHRYRFKELSKSTRVYGLIGNPVSQSPSHITHNAYFHRHGLDAVYVKMQVQKQELPLFFDLVKRLDFKGLSVTTPFKEEVIDFVTRVEEKAGVIGAINTITMGPDTIGSNTDADGALDVLEKRMSVSGKRVAILGWGGAAKAIAFEAKKRGANVIVCARRFDNLDKIPSYDVIINTIPALIHHDPIAGSIVYDINFNRQESDPFIERAKAKKCQLIFGEEMFEAQAALQFSIWGQTPSS